MPGGLIHGDLFDDNVLWDGGGELGSVLDFEMAAEGRFAYDLACTLNAWAFRAGKYDGAVVRDILKGYEGVRELSEDERESLYVGLLRGASRFTVTRTRGFHLKKVENGERGHKDSSDFLQRLRALVEKGPKRFKRMAGWGG